MTTQTQEGRVPELTLGWRLKMALGEMKRSDMADALGVDPGTISRWCSDKGTPPKRVYLMQWALLTGVAVEWLESGITNNSPAPRPPAGPPSTLGSTRRRGRNGDTRTTHEYVPAA